MGQEKKAIRGHINEHISTVGKWGSVPLGGFWKMTYSLLLSCLPKGKRTWGIQQLLLVCHWSKAASGELISCHFQSVAYAGQACFGARGPGTQQSRGACNRKLSAFSETVIVEGIWKGTNIDLHPEPTT